MTIIGGIVFLIPVVLTVVLVEKALAIAIRLVGPVAQAMPLPGISAAFAATAGSVAALVVLCFAAGLVARSRSARRLTTTLEERVLARFPAYGLIKSTAEGVVGREREGQFTPALLRYDDAFQVGFVVERLAGGFATVYLPGAPTAMSGSVAVMEESRIVPLSLTVPQTLALLRTLGAGAGEALSAAVAAGR
ncbi:DUF502 domain-containing protein [Elioraea sp.]|uniref:DUF502 domain-containing protein n=1 Tax=Elioraea sp. TaxID=2185103 RepID=UPI0025B812A1|nr:DUF502 domain-containing protein [Elioraea sp.]